MAIFLISLVVLTFFSSGQEKIQPEFIIDKEDPLLDEIILIKLINLPAKKEVRITQESSEGEGSAIFLSDKNGKIDLSKQAPLSGSCYQGINPMGIFLFEKRKKQTSYYDLPLDAPIVTDLRAEIGDQVLARRSLNRRFLKPGIEIKEIRIPGFVAKLFLPFSKNKLPALIVVGGSEGGLSSEKKAALLASHGFITLALAYFKEEGLPGELHHVPLEIVKRGLDFLKNLSQVNPEKIGLFGGSKGAELALLSASLFPEIKAVVAYSPSHVVWAGIKGNMGINESSWTWQGQPLSFVPYTITPEFIQIFSSGRPWRLRLLYENSLKNSEAVERAAIAVEKINGPILLISGQDDQVWPSHLMAEEIMKRLKKFNHPFSSKHLSYEKAGHAIPGMFVSVLNSVILGFLDRGGTVEGNGLAALDSIPKVLQFLEENLKK